MTTSTSDCPGSTPPPPTLNGSTSTSTAAGPSSATTPSSSKFSSPGAPSSSTMKGRGMQLGTTKRSAAEIASLDSWASEDLMDVSANAGDWTAFESASAKNASAAASMLGFDETPAFSTPALSIDETDDWGAMDDGNGNNDSLEDAWGTDLHAPQPTRSRPSALTTSTNSLQKMKSPPMRAKLPSSVPEFLEH